MESAELQPEQQQQQEPQQQQQSNGEAVKTESSSTDQLVIGDDNPPTSNGDLDVQLQLQQETVTKEEGMEASTLQQDNDTTYDDNETFKMFMGKNLSKPVAITLMRMFEALNLNTDEFDDRAVEMLATFPVEQANFIIKELRDSQLYGVQNKPQYLMSVMRNFRERLRTMGVQQAMELPLIPGPNPESIQQLITSSGYQLEVTVGQRKYHSPPGYEGPDPNQSDGGCIYIGQIPKDVYEDTLVPLFEPIGVIYDLRIMMDPVNGKSRGYGFLIYTDKIHAQEAAKKFDGHEILPGKPLKVNVSVANTRLFLGNIPKSKSKDEILEELRKHAENVVDCIIYSNPDAHDGRKNRGFCFVDFTDHKAASDAKRRISMGKIRPWNTDLVVDWAEQQDEPDEETMAQVKVLYVRNLKESVTEERLQELYEKYGKVDKVKRIKDYAFVHFEDRQAAIQAMEALKNTELDGAEMEISLAKPQGDQNQKKKLAIKSRFNPQQYGAGVTPGIGARGRKGYDYMGSGYRGGRGAGPSMPVGAYQPYHGYPPTGYGPPPYDPYYSGYGAYGAATAGYDMYGGYAADPSAAYYAQQQQQPPQAGASYAAGGAGAAAAMRGGGAAAYGAYGTIQRGRGGKSASGGQSRGMGPKRGAGGPRGSSKRAGVDFGGPASKRGGRGEDFASDVSMNMF
uniref:RRM domain-containing protein n=1 Tax=Globodera rostochiensis TaxID=31243 RepID=A0A914HFF1_GLORO